MKNPMSFLFEMVRMWNGAAPREIAGLRAKGTPNVTKFSTVENSKNVWCAWRPVR